MLTIAIDSSGEIGTLALGENGKLIYELHYQHNMNLLKRLNPNIEQMMNDTGRSIQEIEGVIISLGPGSFTGLRIGITVAKSLAYVLNKPIVGIPTLDAIAYGSVPNFADFICPMIHARAGEVYFSLFNSDCSKKLADYDAAEIGEVINILDNKIENKKIIFCGTGAINNPEIIIEKFGKRAVILDYAKSFARGTSLIELGTKRLENKDFDNAYTITPMYIRKPTPVVRFENKV
jgi:tRNA threonylcarbamoyladenosine biosynthesis protein TsaB